MRAAALPPVPHESAPCETLGLAPNTQLCLHGPHPARPSSSPPGRSQGQHVVANNRRCSPDASAPQGSLWLWDRGCDGQQPRKATSQAAASPRSGKRREKFMTVQRRSSSHPSESRARAEPVPGPALSSAPLDPRQHSSSIKSLPNALAAHADTFPYPRLPFHPLL